MPGLFGLVTLDAHTRVTREHARNILKTMSHSLAHRDDYALDTFIAPDYGLAIARLCHPWLRNNIWPGPGAESTLSPHVFLHGVLHESHADILKQEYLELLPSNAEPLLLTFSGFYSIAMVTRQRETIILSVDRRGSEPLYYTQHEEVVLFAPELKALLAVNDARPQLNAEAVPFLLATGHLLADQTLVSSIHRLPGGCFLQIRGGKLHRRSYWSYRPGSAAGRHSEAALQEELAQLVSNAAKKNLGNPEKTVIFLSGGSDSRGILAEALTAVGGEGQRVNTVCWGVRDDVPGSDVVIAEQLAQKLNLRHTFFQRTIDNYPALFEETNFLIDGSSDVAAFHPHEFTIMKQLRAMGFERVLRGDTALGWTDRVHNYVGAQVEVGIRPLRGLTAYSELLHPRYYQKWSDGSDAVMDRLNAEIYGMEPDDAKDYLYFAHRLQYHLNSAAYYKQILLDHRNVFLDDPILDFIARVPSHLRVYKKLYMKTVFAMYPDLWSVPVTTRSSIANHSSLENWAHEMATDSALHQYLQKQINDVDSGIWEYFDRSTIITFFNSLSSSSDSEPMSRHLTMYLRKGAKAVLFRSLPRLATRIQLHRFHSIIMPHEVLMRFAVLKNWHDTFISGHRPG
jgi:hypothetical protein